jgi:hypothetical protein
MKVVDCLPSGKRCPPLKIPKIPRSLLDGLRVGVCVVDFQKKIDFSSHGAERITANLRHEVVGRPCAGRTLSQCDRHPCEACGSQCPVGAAIQVLESFEDRHRTETGEPREEGVKSSGYADEITGMPAAPSCNPICGKPAGTFAELQVPFGVLDMRLRGFEVFSRELWGGGSYLHAWHRGAHARACRVEIGPCRALGR